MAISYPSNITTADTYMIIIRKANTGFKTSELRNIDSRFKNINTNTTNSIALPVPNNFSDSSSLNYMDNTDASLVEAGATKILSKAVDVERANTFVGGMYGEGKVNQQYLIFNGAGIKSYTFDWSLIPENKQEAQNIVSIIKEFEEGKLPYLESSSSSKWNFPDLFVIKFGGTVKPNLFRFLPCVITNISHNLGDFWQLYKDGNFPEINLSITFSEISSRTRNIERGLY